MFTEWGLKVGLVTVSQQMATPIMGAYSPEVVMAAHGTGQASLGTLVSPGK